VAGLKRVTVALVTRTIRSIPTEVELSPTDGMPDTCVVTLDNVRTVPKALLTERITSLSGARVREVCTALGRATGC
jgi:mRNA interferase MazF